MKSIKEKSYKIVSASAVTLETVAKPVIKHSHKLMMEGCDQIESTINGYIDDMQRSASQNIGWVMFI